MNDYLKLIGNFTHREHNDDFKDLISKILKVYHCICDSHDWDYEFHYVDDVLNNQNGFSEMIGTIVKEYDINKWQEKVIFQALEYDFIKVDEIKEAVLFVKEFNNEYDFFYRACDSTNKVEHSLAKASQI